MLFRIAIQLSAIKRGVVSGVAFLQGNEQHFVNEKSGRRVRPHCLHNLQTSLVVIFFFEVAANCCQLHLNLITYNMSQPCPVIPPRDLPIYTNGRFWHCYYLQSHHSGVTILTPEYAYVTFT